MPRGNYNIQRCGEEAVWIHIAKNRETHNKGIAYTCIKLLLIKNLSLNILIEYL